ncbi:MAG: CoA pyrophosphatase [Neisseria sp.]|uniref:NUDIX hydrolase n=1 Tax=Neisseria sp. TaxID=192066 RepID=UPI0026DCF5C7|nr:CoA pyrophosphatase [Neisseria sp.]MDO4248303.1 CoA pyrophosphatase [Neisseria sp.]
MDQTDLSRFLQSLSQGQSALPNRRNALFDPAQPFRHAAVLLGIVPRNKEWQVLLTKRADTLRLHTGQIAFPGGGRDPEDTSFAATALREAHEEVGTPRDVWQTFEAMPPWYTPSGYAVHTVPALARQEPVLTPDPGEVAEAFYIPLSVVLNPALYRQRSFTHLNRTVQTPSLSYLHYDIWGLTAGILYTLADRFAQGNTANPA